MATKKKPDPNKLARQLAAKRNARGKSSTLKLGLPTYIRSKAYKGKGVSRRDADVIQKAARKKKQELSSRLGSERFKDRLAKQGVAVDDDVLKHADDTVKATPVYATKQVPGYAHGEYREVRNNPTSATKHQRLRRAGSQVRVNPTNLPTDKRKNAVTRHELEHAFDESFRAADPGKSLSQIQGPLFKKLGSETTMYNKNTAGRYSPEELRTDIMELRDEIGSEDVSAEQLRKYRDQSRGVHPGNLPRIHGMVRRVIEANPGMSLEDIAKLINSVAMRQRKNMVRSA
tara:strand:+ start:1726 stop:2586 length:861 start_codon:yes stop_codon:yes gene_type:complete